MRELVKSFKSRMLKGSFIYNLSLSSSASVGIFILQFVTSPILSRLYSPEDYGGLAVFNLLFLYIGSVSSFGLLDAINVSKNKSDFAALTRATVQVHLLVVLLVFFAYLAIPASSSIEKYRIQIPIVLGAICIQVINRVLFSHHLRESNFKANSLGDFFSNFFGKAFSIGYMLLVIPFGNGLILGALLVQFSSLLLRIRKSSLWIFYFSFKKIFKLKPTKWILSKYRKYPQFIFPSNLVFSVSYYLPVLLISSFFEEHELGLFFFALNMLHLPMTAIGSSLKHTFFNKIWKDKHDTNAIAVAFKRLSRVLVFGGMPFLVVAIIFSDLLFGFVFGDQWILAGKIVAILATSFFFQFITSPFGQIRRVIGLEKGELKIQIAILILRSTSFLFFWFVSKSFFDVVIYYGFINSLCYLVIYFDLHNILKIKFGITHLVASIGIGLMIFIGFLLRGLMSYWIVS